MTARARFVDSISDTPTVRLDLLAAPWELTADSRFDPPKAKRAVASTLLMDGSIYPASAYEDRTLELHILLQESSTDDAATAVQQLARELNRPMNFFELRLTGQSSSVFFRTIRLAMESIDIFNQGLDQLIVAPVLAEPFAYGLLETPVDEVTVSTDPAAGSNGCFVDVTGVKGDVEAPSIIRWPHDTVTTDSHQAMFAVRRRGTPSAAPFFIQAESMTQGLDTTTQANDANMSGAGNNFSRTTFATASAMGTRLSVSTVGTASVDLRGRYRVLLRYRRSSATGTINVRLRWGAIVSSLIANDAVPTVVTANTASTVDLGLMNIPQGWDPVTGPDGVELPVSNALILQVQAERLSGTSTFDSDLLVLVPADDRQTSVAWHLSGVTGLDHYLLNAADNSIHGRDSSGRVVSVRAPSPTAGLPMLSPKQTNRIYMLRNIAAGQLWALTTVSPVSVSYHPRYLSVRPAST